MLLALGFVGCSAHTPPLVAAHNGRAQCLTSVFTRYLQAPTAFGLNAGSIASSLRASAAASPFSAAPAMQQRSNMSILAASKMVGAGCATIALAGELGSRLAEGCV